MHCLAESKKIIIVGIPGVGKTTLVTKIVETLTSNHKTVKVVSFGSVMLDEATKRGLKDRDELRKLPMSEQQNLQKTAAESIAQLSEDFVIVDTHAFISTPSGYYPGLPAQVLTAINPQISFLYMQNLKISTIVGSKMKPEIVIISQLMELKRSYYFINQ